MKAKKIILSLLVASPLMLTACPGGDGNHQSGGGVAVPIPGSDPGQQQPVKKPNAFFNGLRKSELALQQKYWFTFTVLEDKTVLHSLLDEKVQGMTTFERLAQINRTSVEAVKIQFYDDIYAFAQNYQVLKLREQELKTYDPNLYIVYLNKTYASGKNFISKRAHIYSRILELREERLSRIGIQSINVITRGVLDINILGVDSDKFARRKMRIIVPAIQKAKTTCDGLNTMLNDANFSEFLAEAELNTCASSPAVSAVSKLTNVRSLSQDQIILELNKSSVAQLNTLNSVADSYLAANSIVLEPRNASGINNRVRKAWELEIISRNPRVRRRTLEKAIDNNQYDNIIFKKALLESLRLVEPNMSRKKWNKIDNELIAISRSLISLRYNRVDFSVGSSAVVNGAGELPSPDVIRAPRSNRGSDVEIEDLDDLDDLESQPAPPTRTPAPKVKDEGEEPPTPPTTIRRP